jgi:protein-tyrosine phosphatase
LIDLHCHLLPGIDDGAADMAASLALAEDAVDKGVTHIVCTPHIHSGYFDNDLNTIAKVHADFSAALIENNIPLKSHYAAECRISPDLLQMFANKALPYIGEWDGKDVVLLELPHSHIPAGTDRLIGWFLRNNVQPMIAHPERNRDIIADYNKALWLKGKGVLFQLTAGVLTGTFSNAAMQKGFKMLEDNLVDIIASDAHSLKRRPVEMDAAYNLVSQNFGKEVSETLFVTTPWRIASKWFQ